MISIMMVATEPIVDTTEGLTKESQRESGARNGVHVLLSRVTSQHRRDSSQRKGKCTYMPKKGRSAERLLASYTQLKKEATPND